MYFGTEPYNFEAYIEHQGDGSSMLREETFGQPRTLLPGDVLANGLIVASEPFEASNGGVGLKFTDDSQRVIASRIPLLLEGGDYGKSPMQLEVGDIFKTGDVVLASHKVVDEGQARYGRSQSEIAITITGGLSGHTINVPSDLLIALHNETYPPTKDTVFGAFVLRETLGMGARARKHLPNHGRLDGVTELERVLGTFDKIEALRSKGLAERSAYQQTIADLHEQCTELRGVELSITGRLHGRGNTLIYKDNPRAWVSDIVVEVISASVCINEGHGELVAQHVPFIEVYGRTVEDSESISAWLGVGEFGVTAKVVEAQTVQE